MSHPGRAGGCRQSGDQTVYHGEGLGQPPFPLSSPPSLSLPRGLCMASHGNESEASHTEKEGKSEKPSWGRRGSRSGVGGALLSTDLEDVVGTLPAEVVLAG